MDCVPGRSTHHTFYVDNVGFYYGQCAEICGRYHHHMPIRLCALTFDQFLVWWQKKGLFEIYKLHNHGTIDPEINKYNNPNRQDPKAKFPAYIPQKFLSYKYEW
jgi:heme/copper-type cytochrome/quinol oxidase subunit 2